MALFFGSGSKVRMEDMFALMPMYLLVFAILLRMQLVAFVMEALRLESLNRPVRDVVS
jgi:hypothetical protein